MNENQIGSIIVDCAIKLHKDMGPGLLESVYEILLAQLLIDQGLKVERQVAIPIEYNGKKFSQGFRADIIINNCVIIEIKSIEALKAVHKKQLLTYLKLLNFKLGFVLNFGEELMKHGITRVINGYL